jgi:shikimate dehydrogenase
MKKFGLIGCPLGHSLSPFIHGKLFSLAGERGEYSLYEIDDVSRFPKDIQGFNVTIPYKEKIIPFLTGLDTKAEMYGAVNTVKKDESIGNLYGYNTDAYGFVTAHEKAGGILSGNTVIAGCGGVGRVAAFETALAGGSITFAIRDNDRDKARAVRLRLELCEKVPSCAVTTVFAKELADSRAEYDLLVNATPAGMYPHTEEMPVSAEVLGSVKFVYDLVYNPYETVLVKTAKAAGVPAIGGLAMLVYQALAAEEIWGLNVKSIEGGQINSLCEQARFELEKFSV